MPLTAAAKADGARDRTAPRLFRASLESGPKRAYYSASACSISFFRAFTMPW